MSATAITVDMNYTMPLIDEIAGIGSKLQGDLAGQNILAAYANHRLSPQFFARIGTSGLSARIDLSEDRPPII